MKNMTKSALFAAALIALPVAAHADNMASQTPGWYGNLGAGMNFQDDTGNHTTGVQKFKFSQPGYDVLGSGGYEWDNGLRLEGEAFHDAATVKNADGALTNTDLFVNGLYDFNNLVPYVVPYVGAGIGVGFVGADNIGTAAGHASGNDTKLAYQGIAGLSVPIDNEWSVSADYRYIATTDPKYTVDGTTTKARLDNDSHNIIFGVRYNFDAAEPMPVRATYTPRPQTHAIAKPVVAPVPQTYQVFFDFNKATLTDEAKRILASAAQEYKGGQYVRIVVTGHTDTKGSNKYNKTLSVRRAEAVKAELVKDGLAAQTIVAKGVGKNGLLVPTNDQVREAQNRRAEIVLDKQ